MACLVLAIGGRQNCLTANCCQPRLIVQVRSADASLLCVSAEQTERRSSCKSPRNMLWFEPSDSTRDSPLTRLCSPAEAMLTNRDPSCVNKLA